MHKSTNPNPRETKAALVRKLMMRKAGADLATLQSATGWQSHSVRAALSTLRKAGYRIDRLPAKAEGGSPIYHLTGSPERS